MSLWQAGSIPMVPLTSADEKQTWIWFRYPGDDGGDLILPSNTGAQTPAGISRARSFAYIIGCIAMALLAFG